MKIKYTLLLMAILFLSTTVDVGQALDEKVKPEYTNSLMVRPTYSIERPEDIKWPVEIDYDALALQQAQEKERAEAIKWPVEIDYDALALQQAQEKERAEAKLREFVPWDKRETIKFQDTGIKFGGYYGKVTQDRLGVINDVYWDLNQSTVDNPDRMSIWGYSGLCGEQRYGILLYDHNYQTGKLLAQCKPGDILKIETIYGDYRYTYESREYGVMDQELTYSASEIGARMGEDPYFIGDINTATYPNGIIESCTNPSTIHNGALYFITCYPLDAYKTDGRLVIKFRSLSGPNLLLGGR